MQRHRPSQPWFRTFSVVALWGLGAALVLVPAVDADADESEETCRASVGETEVAKTHSEIFADAGVSDITLVPRDRCDGEKMGPERDVEMLASEGELSEVDDLGDGSYQVTFSAEGCPDERAEIRAEIDGDPLGVIAEIEVICKQIDTSSPVEIVEGEDGVDACASDEEYAKIEVVALDKDGEHLPAFQEVRVVEDPPYVIAGTVSSSFDYESGTTKYSVPVRSNRCSSEQGREIAVTVGGVELETRPAVEFNCLPIEDVNFRANPSRLVAGEDTTSTVTVEATDACGTPGFGRTASLEVFGNDSASLSDEQVTTVDAHGDPEDGTATTELSVTGLEPVGIRAEFDGETFESNPRLVQFDEPVSITEPAEGEHVGQEPTISGTAGADTTVSLRLDAHEFDPTENPLANEEIDTDSDGSWTWTPVPGQDYRDEYGGWHYQLPESEYTVEASDGAAEDAVDFVVDDSACPDVQGCPADEYEVYGSGGCRTTSSALPAWPLLAVITALVVVVWRRRNTPQFAAVLALAAILSAPGIASASVTSTPSHSGVNLWHLQFQPTTGYNHISTAGPKLLEPGDFTVGAHVGYGHRPLSAEGQRYGNSADVVSAQVHNEVTSAVGVSERTELGIGLPLVTNFAGSDADDLRSFEGSDGTVMPRVRLMLKLMLTEQRKGISAGALLGLGIPTITKGGLHGEEGSTAKARLLVDYAFDSGVRITGNVGAILRARTRVGSLYVPPHSTVHFAVSFPIGDQVELAAEFYAFRPSERFSFSDDTTQSPMELMGAARFEPAEGHLITAGAGPGLSAAYGTPVFRAFAGYSFRTGER